MQSAMNAFNPVKSIGAQFKDAMQAHGERSPATIKERSAEVLRLVGIDPVHLESYPHQLSGGMRQRSMIAMALLFTPDLVIMDEPTSALDVVAQRSLMVQIKELQQPARLRGHLRHPRHVAGQPLLRPADRDVRGQVAEFGSTRQVFDSPAAPLQPGPARGVPVHPGPARAR